MSAGYRSPSELVDLREQNGKTVQMEEKASFFHRAGSAKHFSVRKLVHQFESRASDRFERISGRFSSKGWKAKHAKRDAEANGAVHTNTVAEQQQALATTLWYLSSDKITEDNEEWACADDREPIDEALKEDPFPDVTDICDCYNEFIYLRLSKEKSEYLNSYDSDFEEDDCESFAEASNLVISLKWPGDYVHYIVHGYYQPREKDKQLLEQCDEADDGFSETDDSVFIEAEEATSTTNSEIDHISIISTEKVDGNSTKLLYLIEELLETELNYINTLAKGISTYINKVFDTIPIPVELVNMKYHLFGNIEYIHQFHKSIFLPKLTACGKNVVKVAEVFCKYLENDSFYGYVLYSLYNPKSQRLCVQFERFFEDHQNSSGDKLGVKSFILQPIQRLPRYKLLLGNIVKVLKSSDANASHESRIQLNAVLKAEQLMERFIITQNESMTVNDIVECEKTEDDEVELGFGVPKPATVLREQNSENQFLFLYPRDSGKLEKCKPINILHQGKFKKLFLVFFNDLRLGRQYQGKLFIFERCIIYTEQLKLENLRYRGHFDHHEVLYDFSNLQILKIISEKDEHHSIEVKINIQNPEAASLVTIVDLLRSIISTRKKKESFIIESTELTILRNSVLNRYNSNRSSLSSVSSGYSFYNTCGPDCNDEVTSIDCNFQQAKIINEFDRMVSYHQYYEKALKDSIYFYIYSLPTDVRQQLQELSEILEEILKMQQKINYRLFEESLHQDSELNLPHFCDTFHDSLKQSEFDVYLRYVERSKSAEAVLMSFEQYFTGLPKEENIIFLSIDAFLLLPVEFINRCFEFFEGIHNDIHDVKGEVTLRNTVLDYKIHYVHSQLSLLRQRINENYYIRRLIMDTDFLNEIELVQYSEIVKLEGSYANYRLFLMKPGLLCLKIKQDKLDNPETYSSVTFYCPYTKTTARNSHRSGKRWSVYLDGRKTTLIFRDKQKRHVLNDRYITLAEQMRAKVLSFKIPKRMWIDKLAFADDREPIDEALKEDPFPDVTDICDCYNEFIYLRLSKEKSEYLNSYDSDFEEDDCESFAEASNLVISLKWPGDYVHYIVHGYYQPREKDKQLLEQCDEADDGFSETDDSVFIEAEEATSTTNSEIDHISIIDTEKVDGNSTKLLYLIEELLETELNYINTLAKGISTYINKVFDTIPIPVELVNMKYHLFGNIEYIHQFHKSIFLPKLTACGKNVVKVAEVFCKYLENDSFYGYVLYSLYNPKSQRLCVQFERFFEDHQNSSGDKLGVKSFILQPIQRLPRYKLLLGNIVKVLKSSDANTSHESRIQLNAVLKAEQLMERFIITQNESMTVNDIVECEKTEDDEVELGFGVPKPATVLREQNSENQFLFLYPRDSGNMEKCKPINILHQGKFKKLFLVFFNDLRLGRQYHGKLFIFERCIIYTEQLKLENLRYRGHFDHHEVLYDFSNLQILKIISEKDEHHCIEVKINIQNPEAASLVTIVDLLRSIISTRKKKESFIIESTELTILRNSVLNRYNSNRSSLSSVSSGYSFYNTCGPDCNDEATSIDCNFQQAKIINEFDRMVSYHQYYEKALKDSIYFYIYPLPTDVRQQLQELSEILEEILKMQQKTNYRLFEESLHQDSELNLPHFCDTFHDSLKQSEFDVYLRYVERSKSAEAVLMSFEQYFTGLPKEENIIFLSIDAFLLLPVEFINRCFEFFEGIHNDIHDVKGEVTLRNTVLDYKIHYVHSQLSLLRQRINENYYIRRLIMDTDFLNEIELVQYSEIVKLEGSYANYRLFLMKPGLLCLKIKQDKLDNPETYSSVTFYCPYTKTTARNSHRSGKRWSVYLDGRKTTLIFRDKQKRHVLNDRYITLAEQMRAKVRVKKVSFFRTI